MNDQKDLDEFMKLMKSPHDTSFTRESLAIALYEGTPHLSNLAEKMARQFGKAEAIPFYSMTSQEIRNFWLSIADQIIEHSRHYKHNDFSGGAEWR